MDFNKRSRNANAMLASVSGLIQQLVQVFGNFIYRTVFLMILSKEYLGINGLFSNILQLFSLAELGIGSAILYSMYKPFAQQDTEKISALVRFYKKVYNTIALVVLLIGICFYPFIGIVVDVSEVPSDVNLTVVYFLFVLQSVSSYLFVYKQSLLTADQRQYIVSLFNSGLQIFSYVLRIVVLMITKNYVLVLGIDIVSNILLNWIFSRWITNQYSGIFKLKQELPKEEKNHIYKDTSGLLCHKIGTVIVTSTDNIVLSKYISLAAVGIYSNYSTIVLAITNIAIRVLGSLVPTVANYILNKTKAESYGLFKRMLFVNMWISSFTTVCLYTLLNPFIELWLDGSYLMSQSVVVWICLQHYLQVSRLTANNFINGCGLFMRDRVRPLFESVVNLIVSVVLAKKIGIAGVFIGTCVSGMLTYFWREPYLLYKNYFEDGYWQYWKIQAGWLVLTAIMCWAGNQMFSMFAVNLGSFVLMLLLALVVPNGVILLVTYRTEECRYFRGFVSRKLSGLRNRR